jgi:exodeoxyribonuclease-3
MRLVSWNVNGLRSALKKDFQEWIASDQPEIIGLQESRVKPEQLPDSFLELLADLGYQTVWSCAERAGYSGTALFSRVGGELFSGLAVLDEGLAEWDREGRVTGWRQGNRLLLNVYFPNGGASDERLAYKMAFYADFQKLCEREVLAGRELIVCGDLNTAHREVDLARPRKTAPSAAFCQKSAPGWMLFLQVKLATAWLTAIVTSIPTTSALIVGGASAPGPVQGMSAGAWIIFLSATSSCPALRTHPFDRK